MTCEHRADDLAQLTAAVAALTETMREYAGAQRMQDEDIVAHGLAIGRLNERLAGHGARLDQFDRGHDLAHAGEHWANANVGRRETKR